MPVWAERAPSECSMRHVWSCLHVGSSCGSHRGQYVAARRCASGRRPSCRNNWWQLCYPCVTPSAMRPDRKMSTSKERFAMEVDSCSCTSASSSWLYIGMNFWKSCIHTIPCITRITFHILKPNPLCLSYSSLFLLNSASFNFMPKSRTESFKEQGHKRGNLVSCSKPRGKIENLINFLA